MNKAEAQALWDEVKLNHKRLNECTGPHEFVGDENDVQAVDKNGTKFYRRFICTKCSGKVFSNDKHWYDRGLQHGRKETK